MTAYACLLDDYVVGEINVQSEQARDKSRF